MLRVRWNGRRLGGMSTLTFLSACPKEEGGEGVRCLEHVPRLVWAQQHSWWWWW